MTKEAPCIICGQKNPYSEMTAGELYANGEQAFACLEHAWNRGIWLLGWANFMISQNDGTDVSDMNTQAG